MSKRLIATRADLNIKAMTDMTHPIIKRYADRCSADFMVLDHEPPVMSDDGLPHFRIMKLHDLFKDYDRILSLDSDVVINPYCPDLFAVVPYDLIGTVYEDVGSRRLQRHMLIKQVQDEFGGIVWEEGYINSGGMLTSKCHQGIFTPINSHEHDWRRWGYWTGWGSDDVHLGYQINKMHMDMEVTPLNYKFNHMTMFSEPWNDNANRFDSYIIHYAGVGIFEKDKFKTRNEQILSDINTLYK